MSLIESLVNFFIEVDDEWVKNQTSR